jgi:hypothetical protein
MHNQHNPSQMPKTVDEAADRLIADLSIMDQEILSKMDNDEFDRFYEAVAACILDDLALWTGNDQLLISCYAAEERNNGDDEPARIILKKVKQKLQHTAGIVIIT